MKVTVKGDRTKSLRRQCEHLRRDSPPALQVCPQPAHRAPGVRAKHIRHCYAPQENHTERRERYCPPRAPPGQGLLAPSLCLCFSSVGPHRHSGLHQSVAPQGSTRTRLCFTRWRSNLIPLWPFGRPQPLRPVAAEDLHGPRSYPGRSPPGPPWAKSCPNLRCLGFFPVISLRESVTRFCPGAHRAFQHLRPFPV